MDAIEPLDGVGFVSDDGRRLRMDPGVEEHLVGVDVADPGDPGLVEEQALDAALSRAEDGRELREARSPSGSGPRPASSPQDGSGSPSRQSRKPNFRTSRKRSSFRPSSKRTTRRACLSRGVRGGGEQELAGHLEVEDERPAALALDEEHLAATPDAEDAAAAHRLEAFPPARSERAAGRGARSRRSRGPDARARASGRWFRLRAARACGHFIQAEGVEGSLAGRVTTNGQESPARSR